MKEIKAVMEHFTQIWESSIVDDGAAHVYFFYCAVFVIQKIPAELALFVGTEPVRLTDKPEEVKQSVFHSATQTQIQDKILQCLCHLHIQVK